MTPLSAVHTMTPEEEASWMSAPELRATTPDLSHVYYVLYESGLTWLEIANVFGVTNPKETVAIYHPDRLTCRWCK